MLATRSTLNNCCNTTAPAREVLSRMGLRCKIFSWLMSKCARPNQSDIDWGQGMQLPPPLLALELGESNPTLLLGNRVFCSLVINGDRPR